MRLLFTRTGLLYTFSKLLFTTLIVISVGCAHKPMTPEEAAAWRKMHERQQQIWAETNRKRQESMNRYQQSIGRNRPTQTNCVTKYEYGAARTNCTTQKTGPDTSIYY